MFNFYNTRTGDNGTLDADGLAIAVNRDCPGPLTPARLAAIKTMKPGEWIWWFHFQIVRTTQGLTMDDLLKRT
jgi:hypothetical protein